MRLKLGSFVLVGIFAFPFGGVGQVGGTAKAAVADDKYGAES